MNARGHVTIWGLMLLAIMSRPQVRAQFSLSGNVAYAEGRFGLTSLTESLAVTPTVEYVHERWSLRLSTPHYRVHGPENVVAGIGRVENGRRGMKEASGFGDPLFSFNHTLRPAGDRLVAHEIGLDIKPGLIDAGQLGSGRTDYTVHWGVYRPWRDLSLFIQLGMRFLGDPTGWDLRNHVYATLGWKKLVTRETALGFSYTGCSKTSGVSTAQGQVMGFVARRMGPYECQLSLLSGASRSSPSFGVMVNLVLSL